MTDQILIITGILFNTVGTLMYVGATIKGEIKPNKISFLLWSLAPAVAFFAQIQQRVGVQSWTTLSIAILPFLIFVSSFLNKKAYWKIQLFDLSCGALSLVGLVLWYLTKVGNIAITFSILADGLAALPTIIKAYYYPETESAFPWLACSISGVLTLVTIHQWNFQTYGFPLYYSVAMGSIFFFAWTKIGKRK